VVAKGVDGETKDDVPALSVNATLDPPRAKLADFPGRPPVGFTNIRDQIEAEYGEGNIPSIERSADGSVYYFRLHGDTKVILRDVNSGETAEIALDEGGPWMSTSRRTNRESFSAGLGSYASAGSAAIRRSPSSTRSSASVSDSRT
jgi:hypothetical protein